MSNCAYCTEKPCKFGIPEKHPSDCPTVVTTPENELAAYDEEDCRISVAAAEIEAGGYGVLTRIEEIMEFAIRCGYKKLGMAFCVGFTAEANTVAKIFKSNGFEMATVCCKNGAVDKTLMGIPREKFVIPANETESMCNPVGQAKVLEEQGCQLAIIMGLCVGHDTLFLKHCNIPVTVLAVKDRVTGHNPLAPVYTSVTYRHNLYEYSERRKNIFKDGQDEE